ncbi:helix-turn-helix domain-containing protein (plasmid) [Acidovorax sp. DW039]|uniref:helix-turn-helix domain-containing protein n=1 Tax=Acidovorax sp. DW039 TaxID=3095606 RepID=UPI00308EF312|nr:helix-turn-helix domain-containing protein [Acidovorax sp. DW039]
MKYDESLRTPDVRLKEAEQIGAHLRKLRIARSMTQSEAAARAGVSRSTAVLLEKGDESRTLSQVLRYLHALEPELTLVGLLTDKSAAVRVFNEAPLIQRVYKSNASARRKIAVSTFGNKSGSTATFRSDAGQSTEMTAMRKVEKDPYDF